MEEHINMNMGEAVEMPNNATTMLQTAKTAIHDASTNVVDTVKNYKGNILEIAVYAGVGFLLGFVLKKYLKYILLLILFIVSLIILEQFELVQTNVNWQKIQELFNIQQGDQGFNAKMFSSYVQWIKANFVVVLSASIGFLLGLKLG